MSHPVNGRKRRNESQLTDQGDSKKSLVESGSQKNSIETNREADLFMAIGEGEIDIAKRIIMDSRTDLNARYKNNEMPLHMLMANNPPIEGQTPLHYAVSEGHFDLAKLLIESGAELDAKDDNGRTSLYLAAEGGHYDIVKYLIDSKAEVNMKDSFGGEPLHGAVQAGHYDIVKHLINSKAELDVKNKIKKTPLHYAVLEGRLDLTKLLIESGAELDVKNDHGRTSLHLAAEGGHYDIVKYLIDSKAEVEMEDWFGMRPLHWAVAAGHCDVVKYLIDSKAKLGVKDDYGDTPLYVAACVKNCDAAKILIDSGAELGLANNYGETPLHMAVQRNCWYIVELLIDGLFGDRNKNTASTFAQKFTLYEDICRDEDLKNVIKYGLLYFPELEFTILTGYDLDLFRIELDGMKSAKISVNSRISLHKLLLEEDEDLLAAFMSSVQAEPFADVKKFYADNYPIYASMILRKLVAAKKRNLLLSKFNIVMNHTDLQPLPYPTSRNITKFLANSDLGLFVSAALKENSN